jgi:DNA-binding transcriptional regulator/RsmH inhibitor MraZ
MDHSRESIEFEGTIDKHGRIAVPPSIRAHIDKGARSLRVRLTSKVISSALKLKDVTEEEIERIGALQLEKREQVVKFLLSEGALRGHVVLKRKARALAKGMLR